MNTWPKGYRHPMTQTEHKEWNAIHYPGTRQICVICNQPTENCEDGAIYLNDGVGPLCEECYKQTEEGVK